MANINADAQPDELGELSKLVEEFVRRLETIDNEIELLKSDRKELLAEFKGKLDVKTLAAALRIVKIKRDSDRKHTLDQFLTILESNVV